MNKRYYLGLAAAGFILPYSQLMYFLAENGLNISLIIHQITGYKFSSFAWLDVVLTAIVVIVLVIEESDRVSKRWIPIIATILIGPSCGLPLYLYLRE